MRKIVLVAAGLLLAPLPALSQGTSRADDQDSDARREDRLWRLMHDLREEGGGGSRGRSAGFFLRRGDTTVGIRCDPRDSMRACVDAALTLLDKARSLPAAGTAPSGTPPSER
jgi:hypothetical protein